MPRRVMIGDVLEIPTSRGLAYAQYTHNHKTYGSLIRVIDGLFEARPVDIQDLAQRKQRFVVFFPVGVAVSRKTASVAGHAEIPPEARDFPVFRTGLPDRNGQVHQWRLWDGEKSTIIGELKREQCKIPVLGIVNDTALVWMIETGYTPEKDPGSRHICG